MTSGEYITRRIQKVAEENWRRDRKAVEAELEKLYGKYIDPNGYRNPRHMTMADLILAFQKFMSGDKPIGELENYRGEKYFEEALTQIVKEKADGR